MGLKNGGPISQGDSKTSASMARLSPCFDDLFFSINVFIKVDVYTYEYL